MIWLYLTFSRLIISVRGTSGVEAEEGARLPSESSYRVKAFWKYRRRRETETRWEKKERNEKKKKKKKRKKKKIGLGRGHHGKHQRYGP